jgi:hypothetical protein
MIRVAGFASGAALLSASLGATGAILIFRLGVCFGFALFF